MNKPSNWPIPPWLAMTVLLLLILIPGTHSLPVLDRDEPRFATATREMIDRHDWIVPTFNGHDRFDKPILVYWLMRGGYALFGVGELGARLPSIGASLLLVLFTGWIGSRWLGKTTGWLAALGLGTCLQLFIHGRLALADMLMVAFTTIAQFALAELLFTEGKSFARQRKRVWWWILWTSLGLGFLAKGPIALAVPLLSLLLMRLALHRKPLPWSSLASGRGFLWMLLIIASWGIPALLVTHGRFFEVGIGEHVVQRGMEKFNGRGYTPFFYLGTAPLSLFPWIALLPLAFVAAKRHWASVQTKWLVCWVISPYLIFTCYATQLPHYVLPAFPAIFLLLAMGMQLASKVWKRIGEGFLFLLLIVLVGFGIWVYQHAVPAEVIPFQQALLGAAAALFGLTLIPLVALRSRWALIFPAGLLVALGAECMGRGLRAVNPGAHFASEWHNLPENTRLIGAQVGEPSLVFYTGRNWDFVGDDEAELQEITAQPGPLCILTVTREMDPIRFWKDKSAQRWREFNHVFQPEGDGWEKETFSGFNPGRSRWQEYVLWKRMN